MNELDTYKCYKLILFTLVLIELTLAYKTAKIDRKLCSLLPKRTITLGLDSSSGLIISLGRSNDVFLDWESKISCTFHLKSVNDNYGLFVVIQNIVFRKNETTDQCIDYVQYRRRDGSSSKKYCGTLNAALGMDQIFAPDVYATNLAPTINSFVDPKGDLDITIYIAVNDLGLYEEMELEIVFTSFRSCSQPKHNEQQCGDMQKETCISREFFNDGYVNCPYPDCVDENGCSDTLEDEKKSSIGNKVVIGSVTLLLVAFLFFICFVYLCRKYKKLCWADDFANPNVQSIRPNSLQTSALSSRDIPMVTTETSISNVHHAETTEEDKDLPPAYDTLFPNR